MKGLQCPSFPRQEQRLRGPRRQIDLCLCRLPPQSMFLSKEIEFKLKKGAQFFCVCKNSFVRIGVKITEDLTFQFHQSFLNLYFRKKIDMDGHNTYFLKWVPLAEFSLSGLHVTKYSLKKKSERISLYDIGCSIFFLSVSLHRIFS